MSTSTTFEQLRQLRLSNLAQALEQQLQQPELYRDLSFTQRLELLLDHELQCRHQRRQQRLLRQANLRLQASLNELDYQPSRNLQRSHIAELGQCTWIARAQNLLITGPCGSGKSYVGCAFGHAACLLDYTVRYERLSLLLVQFDQARALGTYTKFVKKLAATALLIIDDWGLKPLNTSHRHDLLELMDGRYGRTATVVISQLPVDQWYATVGDATLADAILDRLIHNAHRIQLTGDSMRKLQSNSLTVPVAQSHRNDS